MKKQKIIRKLNKNVLAIIFLCFVIIILAVVVFFVGRNFHFERRVNKQTNPQVMLSNTKSQRSVWDIYFDRWEDKFGVNWMVNYDLPK